MKKSLLFAIFFIGLISVYAQTDSTLTFTNDSTEVQELAVDSNAVVVPQEQVAEKAPVQEVEPAKEKTPKEKKKSSFSMKKMTFGLNVGATFGDYTSVYVAPRIGYYFTPSTIVGTQFVYRYNSQKVGNSSERLSSNSYGTGLWARQFFLKKLFIHAEWEAMNLVFYNTDATSDNREWVNSIMLGGGYYKRLGKKGGISFTALYIVNYNDEHWSSGFRGSFCIKPKNIHWNNQIIDMYKKMKFII